MFRACTNQSCPSRYTVHQFLYCSSCSLPTQVYSDRGAFFPSPPESQLLDYPYQQQPQIPNSPLPPQHLVAPQARKPPATLNQPGVPPQGSMTWMTPPLSSKSLTPRSHMATPFPNFSRPGSSSIKEFDFYNPTGEKKAKDRLKRTCTSCYNRNDRKCNHDVESCDYCLPKNIWCRAPIRTPKLFDLGPLDESTRNYNLDQPAVTSDSNEERPSACVLSVSWPSAEVKSVPDIHKSSSLLNTKAFFEHRNQYEHLAYLDSILDHDTQALCGADKTKRTAEENCVEILQSCCRRLCSLLQALARPSENAITYSVDHVSNLQALACGILRHLYHKAVAIWEMMFEHLRLWAFGDRNKVGFPSQRKAVAKSLAQVCASIEIYGLAYRGTLRMASPMSNLALDHELLIKHLEFLGKGIDPKVFNAARQTPSPRTTVINVSIVDTNRAIVSDMMTSTVTFRDIMSQKPHLNPVSSFQDSGAYQVIPEVASPLLSGPPSPPKVAMKSTCTSIQSADLEKSISKPDEESTDPTNFGFLRQETEARILQKQIYLGQEKQLWAEQQRQLEKRERKIRQIEEDIYHEQILLGPAEPPAHLNATNFFDEVSADAVGDSQDSHSPGDTTLFEAESAWNQEFQSPGTTSSTAHVPGTTEKGLDYDHYLSVDLSMEDLVPEQDSQGNTPTYTSNKKRKRLSFLPTAEPAVYHERQTDANPSIVRFDTDRATEAVRRRTSSKHFADGDEPPTTSRPTSWPRSRSFRRSAGVSVRKITEVFEKLRLQRDKPLPAPPAAQCL